MLSKKILEIVVCPKCHRHLTYDKNLSRLICEYDQLAYPVRDDIPVLLIDEAQPL